MPQFASLTVAQLRDALREKNLSGEGKKADLVARLAAAESAHSGELEVDETPQKQSESGVQDRNGLLGFDAVAATEISGEVGAESTEIYKAGEEAEVAGKETKPERKTLTPEERQLLVVELLTQKIKRAEKFGDEALAAAARKDLVRVKKFGVDPSTALGKEIGSLNKDVNSELATRRLRGNKKGKGNKKNRGRNNKVVRK